MFSEQKHSGSRASNAGADSAFTELSQNTGKEVKHVKVSNKLQAITWQYWRLQDFLMNTGCYSVFSREIQLRQRSAG